MDGDTPERDTANSSPFAKDIKELEATDFVGMEELHSKYLPEDGPRVFKGNGKMMIANQALTHGAVYDDPLFKPMPLPILDIDEHPLRYGRYWFI
jgi:hypothetical protein